MSLTALSLLKSHMAIDHDADDALLQHKLDAAEAWIERYTGNTFTAEPILTEAAMQLAAYWFGQREAAAHGEAVTHVPFGVHAMLASYKQQITGTTNPGAVMSGELSSVDW